MSANVRCAGLPFEQQGSHTAQATEPCGWKGARTHGERAIGAIDNPRYQYADATAKPCPRCGGRVEMLPTGDTP